MLKKLKAATLTAALRMGAFIGWNMTVLYICQQSLHYYHDDSLLSSVNTTFMTASAATCAVLLVVLLLLDIEGVLSNKLLRWIPGVFMAECGIALSLANAATMTIFAAFSGVAAAFGALAVLTQLMRIKVGQRMFAISTALALGGGIRLIAGMVISARSQAGLVPVAIAVGVISALAIHSEGFSRTGDSDTLVSLAEVPPREIISRVPVAYILTFVCCAAYYFVSEHTQSLGMSRFIAGYSGYDTAAYISFILAAVIIAISIKLQYLPILLVCGAGLGATAALCAGLPYLTSTEAAVFAFIGYSSLACFRASIFLLIIIFSLDRPHPLFYAMFGYTMAITGKLAGTALSGAFSGLPQSVYVITALLLMPIAGAIARSELNRHGFSQQKLDRRHSTSKFIKQKSAELELFDRERMMLESIVLDGYGVNELAGKMLFSRNTVRVLIRPILDKFGVENVEQLRDYFTELTDNQERFMAQIQAAEDEKRAEQRREKNRERINTLRDKYEKLDAARAEKQRLKEQRAENAVVSPDDVVIGGEQQSENAPSEAPLDAQDVATGETPSEAPEMQAQENDDYQESEN